MHQIISDMPESQRPVAGSSGKPWPGLGKQVQVLRLNQASSELSETEQAMAGIAIQ